MVSRRSRGEAALFWDEKRQRRIALVDVGFTDEGRRRRRYVSGRTKTEVKAKLQQARRDEDDGLRADSKTLTVGDAVNEWSDHGLVGREPSTIQNRRTLAERHVIPGLGRRKLVDLTMRDIDRFPAHQAATLSKQPSRVFCRFFAVRSAEHRPRTSCAGTLRCCPRCPVAKPAACRRR